MLRELNTFGTIARIGRFAAALAIPLLASSAQAIDCRKASTSIDRMICRDARLRKADAALGTAYSGLVKATEDAEIRAALVASQKRWLARRDDRLGRLGEDRESPDAETQREILLKAIEARSEQLSRRSRADPKVPDLIATALEQRRFAARFTGGAFAGFETSCDFLPGGGSYSYGCFGRQRFQNDARVCTLTQDWASGSVSETRIVGRVADGRLTTIATCSIGSGGADEACPDSDAPPGRQGGWKQESAALGAEAPGQPLPKLDVDVSLDEAEEWLPACLTDPAFPPPATTDGKAKAP